MTSSASNNRAIASTRGSPRSTSAFVIANGGVTPGTWQEVPLRHADQRQSRPHGTRSALMRPRTCGGACSLAPYLSPPSGRARSPRRKLGVCRRTGLGRVRGMVGIAGLEWRRGDRVSPMRGAGDHSSSLFPFQIEKLSYVS